MKPEMFKQGSMDDSPSQVHAYCQVHGSVRSMFLSGPWSCQIQGPVRSMVLSGLCSCQDHGPVRFMV